MWVPPITGWQCPGRRRARPEGAGQLPQRPREGERRRDRAGADGDWRDEHLFVLGAALAMFDSLAQRILECDAKIDALLAPLGRHDVTLDGPGKRRGKNTPQFDARAALARWQAWT